MILKAARLIAAYDDTSAMLAAAEKHRREAGLEGGGACYVSLPGSFTVEIDRKIAYELAAQPLAKWKAELEAMGVFL
jgi:hypothetical protein